jgi:hypothetical protein
MTTDQPRLTLRSGPQGRVSKGGPQSRRLPTLRDATLRVAPQGEVGRERLGKRIFRDLSKIPGRRR